MSDSSDGDALGPQVRDRVDVRAVVRAGADLEVEVRAGRVAGRADQADLLPGGFRRPGGHRELGEVAVLRVLAVRVLDDDLVAVRAAPAGLDDRAGGDRLDRRAGARREVLAGVALRPQRAG